MTVLKEMIILLNKWVEQIRPVHGSKSFEITPEIAKISTRSVEISPDLAKNSTRSSEISPD